jgi:hypothetical protein
MPGLCCRFRRNVVLRAKTVAERLAGTAGHPLPCRRATAAVAFCTVAVA